MQNDCLSITLNKAVIAGTVTMVTGTSPLLPFLVPGARGIFQVQDNGEGSDANPDLISDVLFPTGPVDCSLVPPNPTIPIDGNISVRP